MSDDTRDTTSGEDWQAATGDTDMEFVVEPETWELSAADDNSGEAAGERAWDAGLTDDTEYAGSVHTGDKTPMRVVNVETLRDKGIAVADDDSVPVPSVEYPGSPYPMFDEDNGEFTTISPDVVNPYAAALYADNYCDNIRSARVDVENWLTLGMAGRELMLFLEGGEQWTMTFGNMDLDGGTPAVQFHKSGNVIYPTDAGSTVVIDGVNCPNVAMTHVYLDGLRTEAIAKRIEMGELVVEFGTHISRGVSALDASAGVGKSPTASRTPLGAER